MAPIIWDQNAVQHVLTVELSIASGLLIVFTGLLFFWLKYGASMEQWWNGYTKLKGHSKVKLVSEFNYLIRFEL